MKNEYLVLACYSVSTILPNDFWDCFWRGKFKFHFLTFFTSPESISDVRVRTKEKYRTVYESWKRDRLEFEFAKQNFVSIEQKTELATVLTLTERQVKIWFQNR